jgi:hypothetical protein
MGINRRRRRFIDDAAPMKTFLTIVSAALLALAALADPATRGPLLNAVVGAAWAQQDRDRGNEDQEEKGRGKEEKDRDSDADKDQGRGNDGKDQESDADKDQGRGNDDKDQESDADKDQGRGNDDKDQDADADKDQGRGNDGKDQESDADKDQGRGNDDKGQDADADKDQGRGNDGKEQESDTDKDQGRGNDDKGQDSDTDKDQGGGNDDKVQDSDDVDNQGRGNEDKGGGETAGNDGNPGIGNAPDVESPRDDGGDNARVADRGADPAERGGDVEREGDLGDLASRFNLDDTETFDDDGFLARRGEIIALSADAALTRRAAALGLEVIEQEVLESLHGTMYRLSVPAASPIDGILARLRAQDPDGVFDRNHLYDRSAASLPSSGGSINAAEPSRALLNTASGISIGLIDTGVDVLHPALQGSHVELQYFVDGSRVLPEGHGTAIASMFVSPRFGLLPGAQLYVASVFYEDRRGGSLSEAQDLVRALDWLMERRVPVINMSLSGPPNEVLRIAIKRALAVGHLIVAAVGNAGPASQPLYPAAYEGVIGVTAVDPAQHVFRRANRGAYVEFAAVGVDVIAAAPGGVAPYSGTSFASPYVAALAAMEYRTLDSENALAARESLRSNALDLGKPGRDEIYGFGLARPRTISTAAR